MKPKYIRGYFFALAGSALMAVSSSHAADGTWNVDANGLWSGTGNWTPGIADGSGSTAYFTNDITATRTVSLNADRTLTSVVFGDSDTATAGSWILDNNALSSNNLILAGTTPGITVNALGTGATATISAIIQGTAGLVKSGSGTLILSGVNTYTGLTTVSNGELQWGVTSALSTGNLTIENGGTANIATFTDTVGTITLNKGGTISGTTGVLAGLTGFVFNGGGTVSGFTTGALAFGAPAATTNVVLTYNDVGVSTTQNIDRLYLNTTTGGGTRTFTINNGDAAVDLDITSYLGLSTTSGFTGSSAYTIYKDGAGVMQLSGSTSNGLWGTDSKVYINEGTLLLNKSSGVALPGVSGRLTIGDDGDAAGSESVIVRYAGTGSSNQIELSNIFINRDGLLDLNGFSESILNLTHSSGGSIKTGAGTLTVTGVTGTISSTSTVTGNLTFSGTASTNLTIGGTADINATTTFSSTGGITSTGTPTIRGTLALGTNSHSIVVSSGTLAVSAEMTGSTGTTTKSGAGTLTLSSTTSTYSGTIAVTEGTLLAGANAPNNSAGAFGISTGAIALGTAGGSVAASILTGGDYDIGRSIRNTTNNNTDTGTRVLTLGGNTAHNTEFSGAIFLGTASQTSKGIQLTAVAGGQVTFSGAIQNPTGQDATEATAAAALTAVTKVGAGTVVLSGTNTYTGGTAVNEGTLLTTKAAALPGYSVAASKVSVLNGATLAVNVDSGGWTAIQINTLLGVTGTTPASFASGSKLGIDVTTGSFTHSSDIGTTQASKGLVKSGAGTLVLDTAHTYTGITTVSAGTLLINGSTHASSAVTVESGAALGGDGTVGGNATFNDGSIFAWNLSVTTPGDTASVTVEDTFSVTGNLLDGSPTGGSVFKIVLAGNQTFADNFWTATHSWDVITSGNSRDLSTLFTSFSFANASGTIGAPSSGSFSLSGNTLTYTYVPDTTAPTPNPMTFATAPYAIGATSITMVATTASDASGVEYFFDQTSGNPGGTDSGWQSSPTYVDTGLTTGLQYTYTVTARDLSTNQNATAASAAASATAADIIAPTPNPMTFATVPYANATNSIAMTATAASDASGVVYFFNETSGNPGGDDSGWQSSPIYEDTGLTTGLQYTYRVTARDLSTNQNATAASAAASATAQDLTAPTPNPMTFATAPNANGANSIAMVATTASDASGVEYFFDETSGNPGGTDSGWQSSPSYEDTGLRGGLQYTYTVTARDQSAIPNATAASAPASATALDTIAPNPNPMTFATAPYANGANSITMVATTATDASGVEYFFDETSGNPGGTDSGWQSSATYVDTGLRGGLEYTYTVTARDLSTIPNATAASAAASATAADAIAPTPNPMTFATAPNATSATSISMVATTASDASGVEYFFDETSGNAGGTDSGWQSSPTYVDTGLTTDTQYTYTVTARDLSTSQNATAPSATASATARDLIAPTPNPMTFATAPYATTMTSIAMVATAATDASGVEYFFDETTGNAGGTDSGWQSSPSYVDTGLTTGQTYTYRVTARDLSANQNATTPSAAASAVLVPSVITITSPTSRHIVQRTAANTAAITITGTYTSVPTEIQARAVVMAGAGNSGTTTAWQTIKLAPSGGSFTGSLTGVPAGGWYQLEVRGVVGGDPGTATVRDKIGVGDIYITAGQSNAASSGEGYYTPTDDRVCARTTVTGSTWVHAADPVPIATTGNTGGSPWPRLGDHLAAAENIPIGFVCIASGGTSTLDWQPGVTQYDDRLKPTVQSFPPNGFRAVLWHQGETDSNTSVSATDHASRLNTMITQSRIDAGWTIPWYVAEASYVNYSLLMEEPVAAGQRQMAYSDPLVFLGSDTDSFHLEDANGGKYVDGLHFNAAGLAAHAQQWRDALFGGTITPRNGNFEDNRNTSITGFGPLADGGSHIASIITNQGSPLVIGWRILSEGGLTAADGTNGFFNPTTGTYAAAVDTSNGGVLTNMMGRHVAMLTGGTAGNYFLHTTRAMLQPNTAYTLSVAIGVRDNPAAVGASFGSARLDLLAEGQVVATASYDKAALDALYGSNTSGRFTDVSLNYVTGATVTPNQGIALRIAKIGGTGTVLDFDNVRLSIADDIAPTPNPMTFATAPYVNATNSIAMTATMASDPAGVEYYFDETTGNAGGTDSGWQSSRTYVDTGLTTGLQYTYTVTARDLSTIPNETTPSAPASAIAEILPSVITLTSPASRHIVQRSAGNTGAFAITGTYTSAPTHIEARAVVMAGTGNSGTTTAWQTINPAPSGGSFSGTLTGVPAGGWYQLEVRGVVGGVVSTATVRDKIGVGDIYITAGQSNSANHCQGGYVVADDRVCARTAVTGTNWIAAADPISMATGGGGSVWTRLGDLLAAADNIPIGFLAVGVGGTQVSQWVPGQGNYDNRLKLSLKSFPAGGFRAVLWHQGESDSQASVTAATHASRLKLMIDQSRIDAGWAVPWYLAEVSFHNYSNLSQEEPVTAGQRQMVHGDPLVFLGPTTDPFHLEDAAGGKLVDSVHFNAAGLLDHAQQWRDILRGTTTVTPRNGNFEDNRTPAITNLAALADGASHIATTSNSDSPLVLGWHILSADGLNAADGSNGFFNPTTGTYAAAVDSSNGGVLPNMNGRHVAMLDGGTAGNYFLHTTRATLQPNTAYTLSVALGVRDDPAAFGSARLDILADGLVVATASYDKAALDALYGSNTSGRFTDVSLNYVTGTTVTPNQTLALRIAKTGGAGTVLDFDNVRLSAQTGYAAFQIQNWGSTGHANAGPTLDPDGDTLNNLQEYAFGTNPTTLTSDPITYVPGGDITTAGPPRAVNLAVGEGVDFRAVFGRRKNHQALGLTYTVQFSAGLDVWVPSTTTPTVLTGANSAGEIEAVSVPYPLFIPTASGFKKPTFFRVGVSGN